MATCARRWLLGFAVWCVVCLTTVAPVPAQESDEEAREIQAAERFVTVLERNPRRGTALDKVYGFHVERGSLDEFLKPYVARSEDAAAEPAAAGTAWMVRGLMESLRGKDGAAVDAFTQAEQRLPDNAMASYYLGQSLVLTGRPKEAAAAFERAIERKPAQNDLLEVFQALGRVYQRSQKTDEALQVWNRLEGLFPKDLRVQEQIARTLQEEGDFAAALPRFENLAKLTTDRYKQSQYRLEAADLKVRLNKSDEALQDFEKELAQLNPDNWLYREVRRRIEQVFLRTQDDAGLVKYYETWLKSHADDLPAMGRLARLLSGLSRTEESETWLKKGLKLAPSNRELRQALIDLYLADQKFAAAVAQYELLDQQEPGNPDTLRAWGRTLLRETLKPEAERRAAAAAIWKRMAQTKPSDPLLASQVADLLRQAELTEEAIAEYRRAIQLAPENPQYLEYLGEYLHSLKRSDEALATWKTMVDGKLRTAANLARLSEVLAGFGYRAESLEFNAEAVKLDPKDFALQLKRADLLVDAERWDELIAQALPDLQKLAANDEERDAGLQREIKAYHGAGKLAEHIETQRTALAAKPEAAGWYRVGRGLEAERDLKGASAALLEALQMQPQYLPALAALARVREADNNLMEAVDTLQTLVAADRRYRSEYLKRIAQLEQRLGRRDRALQAGRDLLASAPGNTENYEFFAQLCFQLGDRNEGLGALRRLVRINPTEPRGLMVLAAALSEQFQTPEAIELYWRAFEKAGDLEERLGIVTRLTDLYLQTNQFDRLIDRLERNRREPNQQRESTLALAQAYQSAGDIGMAREELEGLLTDGSRDTQLLQQLVKLAESDGELESAVSYLRRLLEVTPTRELKLQLAMYLARLGETEEAAALTSQVAAQEQDLAQFLKVLDGLQAAGQGAQVLRLLKDSGRDIGENWELLYREGVALAAEKPVEALARFQQLRKLDVKDDTPSVLARTAGPAAAGVRQPVRPQMSSLMNRLQMSYQVRQAVGLDERQMMMSSGRMSRQGSWSPTDFGQACLAVAAWQMKLAPRTGESQPQLLASLKEAFDKAPTDQRATLNYLDMLGLNNDFQEIYRVARLRAGAEGATADDRLHYFYALQMRRNGQRTDRQTAAMSDEDLRFMTETLATFQKEQFQTAGQSQPAMMAIQLTLMTLNELKLAGKTEEVTSLEERMLREAKSADELYPLVQLSAESENYPRLLELLDRLEVLSKQPATGATSSIFGQRLSALLSQVIQPLMVSRQQADHLEEVLPLFRRYASHYIGDQELAAKTPVPAQRRTNPLILNARGQNYVVLMMPGQRNGRRAEQLEFPTVSSLYDQQALSMLRQLFLVYQQKEAVPQLLEQVAKIAAEPELSPQGKTYWRLSLAYLQWWNGDEASAVDGLREVVASEPVDFTFRLEVARALEKRKLTDEALALVDGLTTVDQSELKTREQMALRLAMQAGKVDRAREASERLFGLRLDPQEQLELGRMMHQLGQNEMAEAVLARTGRQSGSNLNVLVQLMQQRQAQQQPEIAAQVAHQILRKTPQGTALGNQRDEASNARQQALEMLKQTGQIEMLITRTEEQLERAPESARLLELVAEYYRVAGQNDKAQKALEKLASKNTADPRARLQLAQQLLRAGNTEAAVTHYQEAFKREPGLIASSFDQVQQVFQQANKRKELLNLLEGMDLSVFRNNPYQITNALSHGRQNADDVDQTVRILQKAAKDMPDQKGNLIQYMYSDEQLLARTEYQQLLKEAVIPTDSAPADHWLGISNIRSYSGEGRFDTLLTNLLKGVEKSNGLEALATEVQTAREKHKTWAGGAAIAGMIALRQGQTEKGVEAITALLEEKNPPPAVVYLTIGQELANRPENRELAIRFYEAALKQPDQNSFEFSYHPGRRLVTLYQQADRKSDARDLILKLSKNQERNVNDPRYTAYRTIETELSVGDALLDLGYPLDAMLRFNGLVNKPELFTQASNFGGDRTNLTYAKARFEKALKALRPEDLPALLENSRKDSAAGRGLDLVLVFDSREIDQIRFSSVLANVLKAAVEKPEVLELLRTALAAESDPTKEDVNTRVFATLGVLQSGNDEQAAPVVQRLVEIAETRKPREIPLTEAIPEADRAKAEKLLSLWLVARECLTREPLREAGVKLGELALAAAELQIDPGYRQAILREWGQLELARGDRDAAVSRWKALLESVFPAGEPTDRPQRPAPVAPPGTPQPRVSSTVRRLAVPATALVAGGGVSGAIVAQIATPAPPAGTDGIALTTLAKFDECLQLARLAAAHGMPELALEAIRRPLSWGSPVLAIAQPDPNSGRVVFSGSNTVPATASPANELRQVHSRVLERLQQIEPALRQAGASDLQIYELLSGILLPQYRAKEVFLYDRPLNTTIHGASAGLSTEVAQLAVKTGQVEDYRQKLIERQSQPLGQLPASVALVHLAIAAADDALLIEQLKRLDELLKSDSSTVAQDLAGQAVLPLISRRELPAEVNSLLERAVEAVSNAASKGRGEISEEPVRTMRFELARRYYQAGDTANGKRQLDAYLAFLQPLYARYVGEYGQFRRKMELMSIAIQLDRFGQAAEGLELLGRAADFPEFEQYSASQLDGAGVMLYRLLARPAQERYELLKAWSLPAGDRKQVRHLVGLLPDAPPPSVFTGGTALPAYSDPLVSSLDLLVSSAKEAGQLEDLNAVASQLSDQTSPAAVVLQQLLRLERGDFAAYNTALSPILDARRLKAPVKGSNRPWSPNLAEGVLVRAGVQHAETRDLSLVQLEVLLAHTQEVDSDPFMIWLFRQRAIAAAAAQAGSQITPQRDPGLKHWVPLDLATADTRRSGGVGSWWIASDDRIGHVCAPAVDYLAFAYPLTGSFELTCEAYNGPWTEINLGYGGLLFEALMGGVDTQIMPANGHEILHRPNPPESRQAFNPVRLVLADSLLYLFNYSYVVYDDHELSPTSPFVVAWTTWPSAIRNLKITGRPEIPREVALLADDRMDGWITSFYNESQPPRLTIGQTNSRTQAIVARSQDPNAYDWSTAAGVLQGRRGAPLAREGSPTTYRHGESWAYYHRPLRAGERIRYEFFYQPGQDVIEVHPTLDRMVFRLDPAGVKLHWLTTNKSDDEQGPWLATDNVAEEPAQRRGPAQLPLKENDWNSAVLELRDGQVRLELNSELIYERPVEPDWGTRFGFYHDRTRTQSRVRNVILSGDWPEWSAELGAKLLERKTPLSAADAAAIQAILGPQLMSNDPVGTPK